MLRITKARIIKDGKPLITFNVSDTVEEANIDAYKQDIKKRYIDAVMTDIQVDLQYKHLSK